MVAFPALLVCLSATAAASAGVATTTATTPAALDLPPTHRLIGYFDANSQAELPAVSVPYRNLTHLVLTNAVKVDNQGALHLRAKAQAEDMEPGELIQLLARAPVKLVVSLRGHPDDVALDELAEVDELRERFATDMAAQVRDWGASGLEIEWHSDDPGGGKPLMAPFDTMEQYHFALLCRDLAGSLRAAGGKTLSVAVRPGRQEFADGAFVHHYIDWLALRAYSMRSLGDPHHSSLKDMAQALDEWTAKGVPRQQLVLGTPLFARPGGSLHTANDRNEALRLAWRDIAGSRLRVPPDGDQRGDVFLDVETGKAWWASGIKTTRSKVQHLLRHGYGGIAFRDLHHDTWAPGHSLVQAALEASREYRDARRTRFSLTQPMSLFQRGLTRSRAGGGQRQEEL